MAKKRVNDEEAQKLGEWGFNYRYNNVGDPYWNIGMEKRSLQVYINRLPVFRRKVQVSNWSWIYGDLLAAILNESSTQSADTLRFISNKAFSLSRNCFEFQLSLFCNSNLERV